MKWQLVVAAVIISALILSGCQKKCKPNEDADCWISVLDDAEQTEKAIDNLKQIGDKRAEGALLEAFQANANNPEYREKIAEIFKRWGTKAAVKPLMAAIDYSVGPNKDGRKAKRTNRANEKIASALGAIGDKEATGPLLRLMKTTKELTVQRAAIRSLGELKAGDAVEELVKLHEDPNTNKIVSMNAVFALGEIGDPRAVSPLILSLYRDKAYYFFQAGLALVKIGEPAVPGLVDTMLGKNTDAKKMNEQNVEVIAGALESNAAKVLGDIGSDKAVEPLLVMAETVAKWEDEDNRLLVMTRLITALGAIGDKRALKIPLKYLEKELWDVRTVCALAINTISDRTAMPDLLKFATTGEHPRTRAPLIETIGNLGTDEVLPELKKMEQTQLDVTVADAVKLSIKRIESYAQCKDNAACWIGKLNDKEDAVREKATYELGRLGDKQAIDPLLKLIPDQSENVRFAVIFALDRLKPKKAISLLDELVEKEKGSARFQMANFNYQLLSARLSRTGT